MVGWGGVQQRRMEKKKKEENSLHYSIKNQYLTSKDTFFFMQNF